MINENTETSTDALNKSAGSGSMNTLRPLNAAKAVLYAPTQHKSSTVCTKQKTYTRPVNRFLVRPGTGIKANPNRKFLNTKPLRNNMLPIQPKTSSYKTLTNSNSTIKIPQSKPRILKTSSKSTPTTSPLERSYKTTNSNQRLLSARRNQIRDLQSKITNLERDLAEVRKENRLLRQQNIRHERALDRVGASHAELPTVLSRHSDELRTLHDQIRRTKETTAADQRQNIQLNSENFRLRSQLAKCREMMEVGKLQDNNKLLNQLTELKSSIEIKEKKNKDLERHLENVKNNHRHELSSEILKCRETQRKYDNLSEKMNKLDLALKEKNKLVNQQNIYSHRLLRQGLNSVSTSPMSATEDSTAAGVASDGPAAFFGEHKRSPECGRPPLVTESGDHAASPPAGTSWRNSKNEELETIEEKRSVHFVDLKKNNHKLEKSVAKVIPTGRKKIELSRNKRSILSNTENILDQKKVVRQERFRRLRNGSGNVSEVNLAFPDPAAKLAEVSETKSKISEKEERAKKDNILAVLQTLDIKAPTSLLDGMLRNDPSRAKLTECSDSDSLFPIHAEGFPESARSPVMELPPLIAANRSDPSLLTTPPGDIKNNKSQEKDLMEELFGESSSTTNSIHLMQPSLRVISTGKFSSNSGHSRDSSRNLQDIIDDKVLEKFPNVASKYSTSDSSSDGEKL